MPEFFFKCHRLSFFREYNSRLADTSGSACAIPIFIDDLFIYLFFPPSVCKYILRGEVVPLFSPHFSLKTHIKYFFEELFTFFLNVT